MKYPLFLLTVLGITIGIDPANAQFSSFPVSSDACSSFCVKLDLGSANNDNFNSFNSGFNGSSTNNNNLRWQVGVTWRPNPPEVAQLEGERTKQRLEDNRSLMITLADAIAQNKTELARGLAILLAPRLGYRDPQILLAEMKQGSTNIGAVPTTSQPVTPNFGATTTTETPKPTTNLTPVIELR
jgi:hypothetical protein